MDYSIYVLGGERRGEDGWVGFGRVGFSLLLVPSLGNNAVDQRINIF